MTLGSAVSSGYASREAVQNVSCQTWVERTPTRAIPSRRPLARPARQRRTRPSTRRSSKIPVPRSASGDSSSWTQSGDPSAKNGATSGAR